MEARSFSQDFMRSISGARLSRGSLDRCVCKLCIRIRSQGDNEVALAFWIIGIVPIAAFLLLLYTAARTTRHRAEMKVMAVYVACASIGYGLWVAASHGASWLPLSVDVASAIFLIAIGSFPAFLVLMGSIAVYKRIFKERQ